MNTQAQENNACFRANFIKGLQNKKLWVILLLVNVFAIPSGIVVMGFLGEDSYASLILCGFALVVNMLLGMVIPFLQFDYCYDRTRIDFAYSLPLTRKQKFISDFFSGLTMYVGSYLVQMILSYLLTAVYIKVRPDIGTDRYADYFERRLEMVGDVYVWTLVTKLLIVILLIQILLYTVTSFVLSCTGAIFEAISATIYFNILLPSTIYVVYQLCVEHLFGMSFYDNVMSLIYRTSPLGGFVYLLHIARCGNMLFSWVITYLICIAFYFVLTYFIMTRRKAESIGKPFIIRPFYHIVLVAVMLHIGAVACYTQHSLISFLLLTMLFYLIIEIITNRGFKKMKQSIVRYAVIIGLTLTVILSINRTNCFGVAYHVADAKDVSKISISYSGIFNESCIESEITVPEDIETLLEVQKDVIREYKEEVDKRPFFDWSMVDHYSCGHEYNIALHMEVEGNGEHYTRQYGISYADMLKLVPVELSDTVIDARMQELEKHSTFLTVRDVFGKNEKMLVKETYGEPSRLISEFIAALEKDLKNTSVEEYLMPKETTRYVVYMSSGRIILLNSYKNAIAFLRKYNALPEMDDSEYQNLFLDNNIMLYHVGEGYESNIPHDLAEGVYSTANYAYDSYRVNNKVCRLDYSEELKRLLEAAQIQYASDEPCDLLEVYGTAYMIPPQYRELVNQVIANVEKTEE